ncbi:MAG: hypothetical protein E8D52_03220 [Nitrospira sp.]|nr:MAG: hypothetical protein E8D52_03220 [Nitrospira sp.]
MNDEQEKGSPNPSSEKGNGDCSESQKREAQGNACCTCALPNGKNFRVFECAPQRAISVDFRNIYIQSNRGLRFHSANLERCQVGGTNLDACYFNDVRWPKVRAHFPVYALRVMAWPITGLLFSKILQWFACFFSWFYALIRGIALLFSRSEDEWRPPRKLFGIEDHVLLVDELEKNMKSNCGSTMTIDKQQQWEDFKTKWTQFSKAYRDLKIAYEHDKDYIYASDFHFNEKELRRINPEVPWFTKIQLNLFWLINGYGERALRPVGWFLLFFVMGTLVYKGENGLTHPQPVAFSVSDIYATVRTPGKESEGALNKNSILFPAVPFRSPSFVIFESGGGEVKKDMDVSGGGQERAEIELLEAAGFSAATMVFLKPDFLVLREGLSWARTMSWFQAIAGPALFAMFALAIRNKLKR